MSITEKCRKCGIELIIGKNWTINCKNHSDYLCKKCSYNKVKEWNKIHPEKHNEHKRKYLLKLRLEIFIHYSGNPPHCQCPNCDETNFLFLTIDHINNDGAEHRRKIGSGGGRNFYNWLKRNNYPEGFQVLCMNCNFGKRMNNGVCPHCQK